MECNKAHCDGHDDTIDGKVLALTRKRSRRVGIRTERIP